MTNREMILWVLKEVIPADFECPMTCARICREIKTNFEETRERNTKDLNASISSTLRKMWKEQLILSSGPIGPMGGRAYRIPETITQEAIRRFVDIATKKDNTIGLIGHSGLYHLGNGLFAGKEGWDEFNAEVKKHSEVGKGVYERIMEKPGFQYNRGQLTTETTIKLYEPSSENISH